ncbi:hypothetical protein CEUSTIGMA_g2299.t1 [Chlamydomonas eustigma]|uniref:O-fucosyltransferase family protein n=1 Tax=Chlamydomonas eustigma TaxID=1157962 RepID=A0A250WVI1_9CHLO|nr:hypothetical protein CEUSTIGMA_g2299.t1 [Chlamydomonas eustigma]|eukprot:GAX74853.1 hypothetical protein CEUSTIGMA_g2299.t1 [Chlamydomonas eustigma]
MVLKNGGVKVRLYFTGMRCFANLRLLSLTNLLGRCAICVWLSLNYVQSVDMYVSPKMSARDSRDLRTEDFLRREQLYNASVRILHKCSSWINEYAEFHKEAIKSESVKFMLYSCSGTSSRYCAGVGDRMRAMMETVKLAKHSQRAVLFQWDFPAALEIALQPNLLDWRVKPKYELDKITDRLDLGWSTWMPWNESQRDPPVLRDGTLASQEERLISLSTNIDDRKGGLPGPKLGSLESSDRSCLFQTLFQPSDILQEQISSLRKELFGSKDAPYVAAHLRMGMFEGEMKTIERFRQVDGLTAVISCARDLATSLGITASVLLLTDNYMLREHVSAGMFTGFVTTPYPAIHVQMTGATDVTKLAMLTSFLDLGMLAESRCLIGSDSGFTRVARLWGRHNCTLNVEQCIAFYAAPRIHHVNRSQGDWRGHKAFF